MLNMFEMIIKNVIIVIYPSFIRCGFLACITINAKFSPIRFSCLYCGCWWLCRCCCWFLFHLKHLAVDDKNSSGVRSQPWHQLVDRQTRAVSLLFKKLLAALAAGPFPLTLRVLSCFSCGFHSHCETLAGVCIWICVLCGASMCVSHCSCGCVCFYIYMYVCVNVGSIAVAAVVGKCRSMLPSVLKTRKCVWKQQHLWL